MSMTIKDIARETGYSVGTISRVMNNHPNVSEKARATILEAVERSGFILNNSARSLKQQHSESIIAVVKGNSNELFAKMVESLQALFQERKYTLVTDFMDEEDNEVLRARQLCRDKKPQGILFLGGDYCNFREGFKQIEVPCVLVTNNATELDFQNLSSVSTDDCLAAQCAVDYLLDCGHKHIALLGGTSLSDTSCYRRIGWETAYRNRGMNPEQYGIRVGGRYCFQSGYDAMKQILKSGTKVSAVFAMADVMAIGAISAIWDAGLRVPEDISVIGFDGLPIGEFYCPKLTTIEQDVEQLAKRGCELLIECIEEGTPARHETVPFRLNCRQSVKRMD